MTNLLVACVASALVVAAASALTEASVASVTSMVVALQAQQETVGSLQGGIWLLCSMWSTES